MTSEAGVSGSPHINLYTYIQRRIVPQLLTLLHLARLLALPVKPELHHLLHIIYTILCLLFLREGPYLYPQNPIICIQFLHSGLLLAKASSRVHTVDQKPSAQCGRKKAIGEFL
jgi:hypothetical protein